LSTDPLDIAEDDTDIYSDDENPNLMRKLKEIRYKRYVAKNPLNNTPLNKVLNNPPRKYIIKNANEAKFIIYSHKNYNKKKDLVTYLHKLIQNKLTQVKIVW
jgi:hypothetical protein